MAEMRLMERLRGQILTDYEYTWDQAYSGVLVRDDLQANTRCTEESSLSIGAGSYSHSIFEFILSKVYDTTTILDGVVSGNVGLRLRAYTDSGSNLSTVYSYVTIYLISRDEDGNDTTIASTTTKEISQGSPSSPGTWSDTTYDIPFFIDVDNAKLSQDERLILKLDISSKYTGINAQGYLKTALNTDNVFVEIPIV